MFSSKIKPIWVMFLFVMISAPTHCWAESMKDLADAQIKAQLRQLQSQGENSKTESITPRPIYSPPMSVPQPSSTAKAEDEKEVELALYGVYGINDKLVAEIYRANTVYTVKEGQYVQNGWQVKRISANRVSLKREIDGRIEKKELILSIFPLVQNQSAIRN